MVRFIILTGHCISVATAAEVDQLAGATRYMLPESPWQNSELSKEIRINERCKVVISSVIRWNSENLTKHATSDLSLNGGRITLIYSF